MEYGLASAYSVQALRVSQYARYNFFVCGPKFITSPVKFGKDIPTSMEVIEAQTLNFKQNSKLLMLIFLEGRGTPFQLGCALGSLGQSLTRLEI